MSARRTAFWRDRGGVAGLEFALILPFLILVFLGTVTLFQLYRESKSLDQATSTMSDFVSRQMEVTDSFLRNGVEARLRALLAADANALEYRVESIRKVGNRFVLEWAYPAAEGPLLGPRPADDALPLVSDGDTLIVLRTALERRTMFGTLGAGNFTHRSVLAARPRFTQAIIKR